MTSSTTCPWGTVTRPSGWAGVVRLLAVAMAALPESAAVSGVWGSEGSPPVWQQANRPRDFEFPRDHGAHRGFKTEWWYFTGHLQTTDGRALGFQLTWFRSQLQARQQHRTSRWAAHEVFAAHAALSDLSAGRFRQADRIQRAAASGLAGAATDTFDVFTDGWRGRLDTIGRFLLTAQTGADNDPDAFSLDLTLTPTKPPVLQGVGGVSPKGIKPGQASYYITVPRLTVAGTVRVGGQTLTVGGTAWMDHEFGSQQLDDRQVGWDWWGLMLDDGRDLMVYRLRGRDDPSADYVRATLIGPDGTPEYFDGSALTFETLQTWTSPHTAGRYPLVQRLTLQGRLTLTCRPALNDQEMRTRASTGNVYWEGAVRATGQTAQGRSVAGHGYMELVGYAGDVGRF